MGEWKPKAGLRCPGERTLIMEPVPAAKDEKRETVVLLQRKEPEDCKVPAPSPAPAQRPAERTDCVFDVPAPSPAPAPKQEEEKTRKCSTVITARKAEEDPESPEKEL